MSKRLYIFYDERAIDSTDDASVLYIVGKTTREKALRNVRADGRSGCLYSYANPDSNDETFEEYVEGER